MPSMYTYIHLEKGKLKTWDYPLGIHESIELGKGDNQIDVECKNNMK